MSPSFGYVMPPSEGFDVPDPEKLWEIAQAADESPLDHLWVSDHIMFWHPMYESLSLLSALAVRTRRIRLGTAVLLLAMRNPVLAAKTLATIERLSSGRLTVGVGIGGEFPPEWEAVGVPTKTRARRTDEMIEALKGLWREGPYDQSTRHVDIEGVDLYPKPSRPPQIWIGGRKEPAIERAARLGDGWMGLFLTPEQYGQRIALLSELCDKEGRVPSEVFPSLYVWTCIAESTKEAKNRAALLLGNFYNTPFEKLERYAVIGDPEQCASRFGEFADAGVKHFAVAPITAEINLEPLQLLAEEVMPGLTE